MPHHVLVEGPDDKTVFDHLLIGQPGFEIAPCGGNESLSGGLEVIRNLSKLDRPSLKIVFDAEADEAATFASIKRSLVNNGFEAPERLNSWSKGTTPVLIHLITGAGSSGCLEDLFLAAIKGEREHEFGCLEQLRNCWPETKITEANWSKLFANVLLQTTQGNKVRGVGNALIHQKFSHLLTQEPFVELRRILSLLPPLNA